MKNRPPSDKEIKEEFKLLIISLIMRGEEKIFESTIKRWAGKDLFLFSDLVEIAEEYGVKVIWR